MESRRYFAQQVAKTLIENHAKDDKSSFIFGISGKWGEGKTRFLGDLTTELKERDNSIQVYTVNPWKFSSDKVSFMRDFLRSVNIKLSWSKSDFGSWVEHFLDYLKHGNGIKNLEFDKTKSRLNWGGVFLLFGLIILVVIVYRSWPNTVQSGIDWVKNLPDVKWLITALLLPIFVSFFPQLITTQKSSHAISTVEQFDELLGRIIKKSIREGNKIIVFVDDLDRVTPDTARSVLDNLRTFFDKKEISFVVTGDHSILERHLGRELLPDGDVAEQLEEGRRFLKKIFDVYWRLPLPINNEFKEFITQEIEKRSTDLSGFFDESQRTVLGRYLEKYFDKNFRHVIRFLDTIVFTFQIIKLRSSLDEVNKNYFEEILKNPLLVVRVLMFQELCAPFFDMVCKSPELLAQIEYAAEMKKTEKITSIMSDFPDESMSTAQRDFVAKYIYEEPRFYSGKSLRVSNIEPFLFLAADASLGDQRGPSSEDFLSTLDLGDPEQVKNSVLSMGDEKAGNCAEELKNRINQTEDPNQKDQLLRTASVALSNTTELFQAQNIFLHALSNVDFGFYGQLTPQQRTFVLSRLWAVLDRCHENDTKQKFASISAYRSPDDVVSLDQNPITVWGAFTAQMVLRWLKANHDSSITDTLLRLNRVLPEMKKANLTEVVESEISEFRTVIIDGIINDADEDNRLKRYEIIKYSQEASAEFKKRMLELVSRNHPVYDWLKGISALADSQTVIVFEELQKRLIENVATANNKNQFVSNLLFAANKITNEVTDLWWAILKQQSSVLSESLVEILGDTHYMPIIPVDNRQSTNIFNLFVGYIGLKDDAEKKIRLPLLQKTHWFWAKTSSVELVSLSKMKKDTKDEELKKLINSIIIAWPNAKSSFPGEKKDI